MVTPGKMTPEQMTSSTAVIMREWNFKQTKKATIIGNKYKGKVRKYLNQGEIHKKLERKWTISGIFRQFLAYFTSPGWPWSRSKCVQFAKDDIPPRKGRREKATCKRRKVPFILDGKIRSGSLVTVRGGKKTKCWLFLIGRWVTGHWLDSHFHTRPDHIKREGTLDTAGRRENTVCFDGSLLGFLLIWWLLILLHGFNSNLISYVMSSHFIPVSGSFSDCIII